MSLDKDACKASKTKLRMLGEDDGGNKNPFDGTNQIERAQATFSSDNMINNITIVILNLDELKAVARGHSETNENCSKFGLENISDVNRVVEPNQPITFISRTIPPIFAEDVERETTTSTFRETQEDSTIVCEPRISFGD
ncbi:hypothetical protein V6N12_034600 [Hibiscus sabdariffa]|uniref:Uncharacterized protein n=1 Tax=Hibiscus sabdariffa TaxID=183260 RepID=A0ABR2DHM9_9ROSI